jgi:hypothetical protein
MSPAATITPDAGAVGRRIDFLDQRQDSSDFTTCGSVVPSDRQWLRNPSHQPKR